MESEAQAIKTEAEERALLIQNAKYRERVRRRAEVAIWNETRQNLSSKVEKGEATRNPETTLFVGRLTNDVTEAQLKEFFSQYAPAVLAVIVRDEQCVSQGYGFVEFASKKDASVVWEKADGQVLGKCKILVDWERARKDKKFKPARLGGPLGHLTRKPKKRKISLPPLPKAVPESKLDQEAKEATPDQEATPEIAQDKKRKRREARRELGKKHKSRPRNKAMVLIGRDPQAAVSDIAPIQNRSQRASLRLMRDWRNLTREPLAGIQAMPVRENLFDWHIIMSPGGLWGDGAIHFRMLFPRDRFPAQGPKVYCLSTLRHPNAVTNNRICMHVLDEKARELQGPYSGWSSGIDLSGILVQLQSILLDSFWTPTTVADALSHPPVFPPNFLPDKTVQPAVNETKVAPEDQDDAEVRIIDMRHLSLDASAEAEAKHPTRSVLYPSSMPRSVPIGTITAKAGLNSLPRHLLVVQILAYLGPDEAEAVGCCCRGLYAVNQDDFLWRDLFSKRFQGVDELETIPGGSWRFLYLLQSRRVFGELRCFHSRKNFTEDLLGIPITFTRSATRLTYIHSTMDLVSREAFFNGKHFVRALPFIQQTIADICHSSKFQPSLVLDVLPNLITTQVVLLMDEGISASAQACQGFVLLHRLFLALCARYPDLQREVEARIETFISTPAARCKPVAFEQAKRGAFAVAGQFHPAALSTLPVEVTPDTHPAAYEGDKKWKKGMLSKWNLGEKSDSVQGLASLGDFVPLFFVSRKYRWEDVAHVYLGEGFDRAVLWRLSRFPELKVIDKLVTGEPSIEEFYATHPSTLPSELPNLETEYLLAMKSGEDHERLRKAIHQSTLVTSLLIFLSSSGPKSFRRAVTSRGDLDEVAAQYDRFYGNPSPYLQTVFRRGVEHLQKLDSWIQFFQQLGLAIPPPRTLLSWLQTSNLNSQFKGYHSVDTDFAAVRGNTRSNILLRGCSYPKIVFLIDVSGSMDTMHWLGQKQISRLQFVKDQLAQVLNYHVESHQQFLLVPFQSAPTPLCLKRTVKFEMASQNNIKQALETANKWRAGGGTDIMKALTCAYSFMGVSAVFLLSDGEADYNLDTISQLARSRGGEPVPCHPTALCAEAKAQNMLSEIARVTGGIFRNVSSLDQLDKGFEIPTTRSCVDDRLKREGVQSAQLTVALTWDGKDDLDLSVTCPCGTEICFLNKTCSTCGGELNGDMNGSNKHSDEPIESVTFPSGSGPFSVAVTNTNNRSGSIEVPFQIHILSQSQPPRTIDSLWNQDMGTRVKIPIVFP